jgi:hypothetical protein
MLKLKFVSKEEYAWWNFDKKFQTKQSIAKEITKRHERKEMDINTFINCMFKEKYEKIIIGMQFVRLFLCKWWQKKLILETLKS